MTLKTSINGAISSKIGKIIVAIIVILLAACLVFWTRGRGQDTASNTVVTSQTNTNSSKNSVRVTGKVAADSKAELGFDRVGVVSNVFNKVGDSVKAGAVLITLDTTEESASVDASAAALATEESNLRELERGLRTEEYSVERSKVVSASVDLNDATLAAQNALKSAYVDADKAVHSYVGTFYSNSYQPFPDFQIATRNQIIARSLSAKITEINTMFDEWKKQANEQKFYDNPINSLRAVRANLQSVKEFFAMVESTLASLTTNNSNYSAETISGYLGTMNSANEILNTASSEVIEAEGNLLAAMSSLEVAKNGFVLKRSGSSTENLDAARAKVDKALADLSSARAQFSKNRLISPIDGVVSNVDIDKGEVVKAGEPIVSIISDAAPKIEVFVPEVDIANVELGKEAAVTLDAYGPSITWRATVSAIDPAETIVEGVSTYKVTLHFVEADARIKPGMTANIEIAAQDK